MIKYYCDICQNECNLDDLQKTQELGKKFGPTIVGGDIFCILCRPFHEEFWKEKGDILNDQLVVMQSRLKRTRNQFFTNVVIPRTKESTEVA